MKSTYDTYGNEQRIRISYTFHKKDKESQTDEEITQLEIVPEKQSNICKHFIIIILVVGCILFRISV